MMLHRLDRRGVAQAVIDISKGLVDRGCDVTLVATGAHDDVLAELPARVRVRLAPTRFDRTVYSVPQFAGILRDLGADIIFSHHNGPNRAAVQAHAVARVTTPLVTVEHIHYTQHIPPAGRRTGPRWLRDLLTGRLYARADLVAGVSPDVVDDLVARFGFDPARTAVLPAPGLHTGVVPLEELPPVAHPWYAADSRVICSVANISSRKGQHLLVAALPTIRDRAGDVRLVLVGRPDDAAYARSIDHLARELGMAEFVDMVGYQRDPRPWMAHAHAFALTSYNEGCPRVLSEAMAMSVPVVATDAPSGAGFILDGGSFGMLVPVGDVPAIADALVDVLEDVDLARGLVERGRERCLDFTGHAISGLYLDTAARLVADS